MNMREYEIFRGYDKKLDEYPEYIRDIIKDLNDYVDTIGTRIVDVDNYMVSFADIGTNFTKMVVRRYNELLTEEVDDTDLCILTIVNNQNSFINTSYERVVEILNLLGFVNIDSRFNNPDTKIFLYVRNNAGEEYYNAIRFIVFTFLENYGKIGV